jgi:hypothetical protein
MLRDSKLKSVLGWVELREHLPHLDESWLIGVPSLSVLRANWCEG